MSGRAGALTRWSRVVGAVAARPGLWPVAARQARRLAGPDWWRRWPPLPRPDPGYLRFRMQTAYGDPLVIPPPGDVVDYLKWCRRMEVIAARGSAGQGARGGGHVPRHGPTPR